MGATNGRFGGGRGEVFEGGGSFAVGDELAHVRARFAIDPSKPARLADAWKAPTGTTEEDESELIDAVADCLSVGVPIDAAIASWRAGLLEVSERDDDEVDDEEDEQDDSFDDAETGVFRPRDG